MSLAFIWGGGSGSSRNPWNNQKACLFFQRLERLVYHIRFPQRVYIENVAPLLLERRNAALEKTSSEEEEWKSGGLDRSTLLYK